MMHGGYNITVTERCGGDEVAEKSLSERKREWAGEKGLDVKWTGNKR